MKRSVSDLGPHLKNFMPAASTVNTSRVDVTADIWTHWRRSASHRRDVDPDQRPQLNLNLASAD